MLLSLTPTVPQFAHHPEQKIAEPGRTLPIPVLGQSPSSLYYQIVHGIKTQKGTRLSRAEEYSKIERKVLHRALAKFRYQSVQSPPSQPIKLPSSQHNNSNAFYPYQTPLRPLILPTPSQPIQPPSSQPSKPLSADPVQTPPTQRIKPPPSQPVRTPPPKQTDHTVSQHTDLSPSQPIKLANMARANISPITLETENKSSDDSTATPKNNKKPKSDAVLKMQIARQKEFIEKSIKAAQDHQKKQLLLLEQIVDKLAPQIEKQKELENMEKLKQKQAIKQQIETAEIQE